MLAPVDAVQRELDFALDIHRRLRVVLHYREKPKAAAAAAAAAGCGTDREARWARWAF